MEVGFGMAFGGAYASHFRTPSNKATPPNSITSSNYGGPSTSEHFL